MVNLNISLCEDDGYRPAFNDVGGSRFLIDSGATIGVIQYKILRTHPDYQYVGNKKLSGFGGPGFETPVLYWKRFVIYPESGGELVIQHHLSYVVGKKDMDYSVIIPLNIFKGSGALFTLPDSFIFTSADGLAQCPYLRDHSEESVQRFLTKFKFANINKEAAMSILCSKEEK